MEQTLLLNATYEPLKVVHWQKAVTLWCQGKVEVISVYDRESARGLVQLQAALGHPPAPLHQIKRRFDYVPFSRAKSTRATTHCQYCGDVVPDRGADLRSCRAGRPGRPQGLGEHRHLLHHLQPPQGRADARRGRHAPMRSRGARQAPAIRITIGLRNAPEAGATTSTGTSSSTTSPDAPARQARGPMSAFPSHRPAQTWVRPLWAIEGGRVTLEGADFPVDPAPPIVYGYSFVAYCCSTAELCARRGAGFVIRRRPD